ncbi:hypothetical protein IFM89_028802 [Coptis chinensis]|uniref:MORF/ORRM1/DAG-like MORF domain-containing protein n=1 Tax=Coptis chinensis TaxID=261450 RepID=A0A835LEV6_9MAGN|nr:hypothetical protein IFM89_028802 [Coptis chinensis]
MMRSSLISCTSCATAMMRSLVNSSIPATTRTRFLHTCCCCSSSSINIMNKPSFSVSKISTIHRDFCSSTTSVWNPERVTNLYILARGKKPPDPVKSKPGDRWLVGLKISGIEFLTEQQLFDFYVDVLASVLPIPSKEEARKKIYLVSCERPFGFGAKIDADSAYELNYRADRFFLVEDHYYGARNKDPSRNAFPWGYRPKFYHYHSLLDLTVEMCVDALLQDVLEVLPDYSFDAKSKCANGEGKSVNSINYLCSIWKLV